MKLRQILLHSFFVLLTLVCSLFAQVDSGIKRFSPPDAKTYITDMSGDGRFVVIESDGNIATYNPRNADKNREIFLLDYAQRHIFQLTDTKSTLRNPSGSATDQSNVLVLIASINPTISNDGRWIAFSSNATTSTQASPNNTNPGNFDGNAAGASSILQQDGNTELWLYALPNFQQVDLSTGDTPAFINLSGGTFTRITNTNPTRTPFGGTATSPPVIADDNMDASINDDGSTIAFISNRDLIGSNGSPNANDEVFVYKRIGQTENISQITVTPRGRVGFPILQDSPSISGDGRRVVFTSNTTNPIPGMSGGCNPEFNWEVNFTDLNEQGTPDGIMRQVTFTNDTNTGAGTVYLDRLARSISRDGRYIIITTRANLNTPNDQTIRSDYANFIYDSQISSNPGSCQNASNRFTQMGPRFGADSAIEEDVAFRYPRFTDYAPNSLTPASVVFSSRMNFRADGTVPPANSGEGFNPSASRPIQIYSYSLSNLTAPFARLSNSTTIDWGRSAFTVSGNTKNRVASTISDEFGNMVAGVYLLSPATIQEDNNAVLSFFTGASAIPINSNPPQAQGLMPNMLGSLVYLSQLTNYGGGFASQVSRSRVFAAPLQLKGVTLTIDGVAANLTRAYNGQINFIVPPDITAGVKPVVVNDNGTILRGNIQIIQPPQPDIVTNNTETTPSGGGRARILDVTDPNNPKTEPFTVTTQTANGPVPTKLRLFITGVQGVASSSISIRIGNITVSGSAILTSAVESDYPGMFTFDFTLPQTLNGAGDLPLVVTVDNIESRSISTAPHILITANQIMSSELAVWRPGNGYWYILGEQQQVVSYQWGMGADIPAPADYDGDGKTDFCIYRPSLGEWHIVRSSDNSSYGLQFGIAEDIPAAADFDGDGKADLALWRPSTLGWYILQSSNNTFVATTFGASGDKPVPADFDGDGKADFALWRNNTATFWVKQSSDNQIISKIVGQTGDQPLIGDYNGDGKFDFATRQSSNNTWKIQPSSNSAFYSEQLGVETDIAVPGDYDKDGKTDIAVWRPSTGMWYIRNSHDGSLRTEQWGMEGDIPVPAPYRR